MARIPMIARVLAMGAIVASVLFGSAVVAFAAPTEPTLGLADLQTKLDAAPDGVLDGYFKTVVKGSDIVTIPCQVLAITGGSDPSSSLILFEASGPLMDKFGGIVAGMSGSPIYVEDQGVDKIVGAVSYGDWFTLHGTGLATPIEYMTAIEDAYSGAPLSLSRTVAVQGHIVNQVTVTTAPGTRGGFAGATIVAKPLAKVFIGGLNPSSRMYKRLASSLASRGVDVYSLSTPLGGTAIKNNAEFSTDLTAGASLAVLEARGDMWVGSLGTVTYSDGNNVLGYGHPEMWSGPSNTYMLNGWIDGIWPSSMEPYKLGRPGALRGAITQDRNAGVMGVVGQFPADCPVVAHATDTDTGKTASTTVFVPQDSLDNWITSDPWLITAGAYTAGYRLFDAMSTGGSAHTTTTVEFSNGVDSYSVVIPNMVSDSWDVPYAAAYDVDNAMWDLTMIPYYGLEHVYVKSVTLDAEFSSARKEAQIIGLDAPNGLKTGQNLVRVSLQQWGEPDTQTVDCTVTIPPKTVIGQGMLQAMSGNYYYYGGGGDPGMSDYYGFSKPLPAKARLAAAAGSVSGMKSSYKRPTVADVATRLAAVPPNNLLTVKFVPRSTPATSFETTVLAPWVLYGGQTKYAPTILAKALPTTVAYNGAPRFYGYVVGPWTNVPLTIFGMRGGETTEASLATCTAASSWWSTPFYSKVVKGFRKNTIARVHFDGNSSWLSADATISIKTYAKVVVKSSPSSVSRGKRVTLYASIAPTQTAGGAVTFQYYNGGAKQWRTIGGGTLALSGNWAVASRSWIPPVGSTSVRAIYAGGVTNPKTVSGTIYVKAK